jgi:hypothetical protein
MSLTINMWNQLHTKYASQQVTNKFCTSVPKRVKFMTLDASTSERGFTLQFTAHEWCVSWVVKESNCTARMYNHKAVYHGLFFVALSTFGQRRSKVHFLCIDNCMLFKAVYKSAENFAQGHSKLEDNERLHCPLWLWYQPTQFYVAGFWKLVKQIDNWINVSALCRNIKGLFWQFSHFNFGCQLCLT